MQSLRPWSFSSPVHPLALNRVTGRDPSSILGNLYSNGIVFLINPNGILFGAGSVIDTGSFLASTLNITDDDFLKGNYSFDAGGFVDAHIINNGLITVSPDGFISLLAPDVINNGYIAASTGKVVIASGEKITLDFDGDGLISFSVDGDLLRSLIENSGHISASGGEVLLTAKAASEAIESVINNSGVIEANAVVEENGVIRLVNNSGSIDNANSINNSGTIEAIGGEVHLEAKGDITSLGTLRADYLYETGASFRVGGTYEVGTAFVENDDRAITIASGDYSGLTSDAENIIIDTNAAINLTGDTTFTADSDTDGDISYSYATGSVEGKLEVGGLVGWMEYDSTISYSYATGNVTGIYANDGVSGNKDIGGLVGVNVDNSTITCSYATGNVSGKQFVGGLAGVISDNSTVSDSYAQGSVTGVSDVGGLVGLNNSNSLINNSSVAGTMTGALFVGGLVGSSANNSQIIGSYATGSVTGSYRVGGLVGWNIDSEITSSYAENAVNGNTNVGGFIGYDDNGVYGDNYWYSYIAGLPRNQDTGNLGDVDGIEDRIASLGFPFETISDFALFVDTKRTGYFFPSDDDLKKKMAEELLLLFGD